MSEVVGRRTWQHGRAHVVLLAAMFVAAVWSPRAEAVATAGAAEDAGSVVIVDLDDPEVEVVNGGSATRFSLRLPEGSVCPGDSAHDQWRVQSFIVPSSVDPGELSYGVIGPEGAAQFALFAFDSRQFAHQLTRPNLVAGQPGVLPGIPAMTFEFFRPGELPEGAYRIGLACTYFRETAYYWDTEILISAAPEDRPAQLTWRVPDAPEYAAPSSSSVGRWATVAVAFVVAAAVSAAAWRHRIRPRPQPLKEAR